MAYRTLNYINKSVASDVESFIESAEEDFDRSVSSLVGNFISDCDCDIVLLAGGGNSGDPELSEVALLQLSADIGIVARLHDLLMGHLVVVLLGAPEALGLLNDLLSSLARHHRAFYSCHLSSSFRNRGLICRGPGA